MSSLLCSYALLLCLAKSILIIVVCTLEFWASFTLLLLYTIYVLVHYY